MGFKIWLWIILVISRRNGVIVISRLHRFPWPLWPPWPVTNFLYRGQKCPHLITEVSHDDCDHSDRSQNVCVLKKVSVTAVTIVITVITVTGHKLPILWPKVSASDYWSAPWWLWLPWPVTKCLCAEKGFRDHLWPVRKCVHVKTVALCLCATVTTVTFWLPKCPMMTVTTVTSHKVSCVLKKVSRDHLDHCDHRDRSQTSRTVTECLHLITELSHDDCDHRDHIRQEFYTVCFRVIFCDRSQLSQNPAILWPVTNVPVVTVAHRHATVLTCTHFVTGHS